MSPPELLYYGLGKGNSYGHASRSKDHIKSMSMVDSLLRHHAEAFGNHCFNIQLIAERDPEDSHEREKVLAAITSAVGKPSQIYGQNLNENRNTLHWLQKAQIPLTLKEYLLSLSVDSRQFSKKFLIFSELRTFHWRNYDLPPNMLLTIISHDRFSLQPNFWFPNTTDQEGLSNLISVVSEGLPVKFGANHFKKAIPKKNGSGYLCRKIDDSLIAKLTNAPCHFYSLHNYYLYATGER